MEGIVGQQEAEAYFGKPVYEAPDHLLGRGTRLALDRVVPEDIVRRLRRDTGKPIKIASNRYMVDANSLRTTGRITEGSAALLDYVLGLVVHARTDPEFREGEKSMRLHMSVERSPAVRRAAIAIQGTDCKVCGFTYRATYGPLGEGFIEVHHLSPLGKLETEVAIDPATDVIVLCANCHRMIHRREPPLTPDQLRAQLTTRR